MTLLFYLVPLVAIAPLSSSISLSGCIPTLRPVNVSPVFGDPSTRACNSCTRRGSVVLHAMRKRIVAVNKQARRNYDIIEDFEVGVQLLGTEVKAIRSGSMNLQDGYAQVKDGECWLKNVHIGPHQSSGGFFQHEALRERRLLLHKREIRKLAQDTKIKQLTLVPINAYFNEDNRLKIRLGIGKGKNMRDKRDDIKNREAGRELQRAMKRL
mmetsp:Transcript_36855/g.82577  ORF Transcript_36855/g.82577 Transcript_36855/m.82577 type:complete len:211 (-) Transcript_36855:275-907(-)